MRKRYIDAVKALLRSNDPADVAKVKAANEALLRCKGVSGTTHNDSTLANLSQQYKNEEFIGVQLMPVASVVKMSGKWPIYGQRDRLSGPDDALGKRSTPNEINETRTMGSYSCDGYGLIDFVDSLTLKNEDAPLNDLVDLVQGVNDVLDLKEEIRIASFMTTSTNYTTTTGTVAVAAASRWNVATSDPVANIVDARDALWSGMGATRKVAFCGAEVWSVLRRHPKILDLFKAQTSGLASRQQVAQYFDLDDLLVGRARKDTANEGQTASYSRVWGKQFGIVAVANNPTPRTAAFGLTLRFQGQRTTTQWFDDKPGTDGGWYAKVAMNEVHVGIAKDAGFLYTTVID
jgi:hypothetical protein